MANAILQQIGVEVVFSSTGDVAFSPASTAFNTGHKSDLWDRGASPQSDEYSWRIKTKLASGSVGETIELYMATSNNAVVDGGVPPGNAGYTDKDARSNLLYMGSVVVQATGSVSLQTSGVFRMTERYGVLVWWNATTGSTLTGVAGDHALFVKPVYPEVQ